MYVQIVIECPLWILHCYLGKKFHPRVQQYHTYEMWGMLPRNLLSERQQRHPPVFCIWETKDGMIMQQKRADSQTCGRCLRGVCSRPFSGASMLMLSTRASPAIRLWTLYYISEFQVFHLQTEMLHTCESSESSTCCSRWSAEGRHHCCYCY